jgi:hypothetical protein
LHREERIPLPRNALGMAPLRSLLVLLILLGLICAATAVAQAPVEWYTESGGGALAGPAPHDTGGGATAPTTGDAPATVNLPPPTELPTSDSPPAQAARAPVATAAPDAAARPPAEAPQPAAAAQAEPSGSGAGSLPFTGLELAVMAAAGLCLLLAGVALRPRAARR